ncbi:MAG: Unknown protein [uncultured Aureispira sp.]|uniref:Uncharacterized protein n=1 Tax=uncultured Aureispira sp. TaxID=1331704 RepID=A0A6S6TG51_9BACT|nr:MAG: Unknown protein [uncultured Aureispira sp.]
MNLRILFIMILTVLFWKESVAQTYYHYSRTQYTYGPYYFSEGLNFVKDIVAYKRMKEKRAEFEAEMRGRTEEIRDYYKSFEKYPEKVADGWHTVTILAGSKFIDNRKVLVENNKIRKVYWDNWMEEKLVSTGSIVEGSCKIQLNTENQNLNRLLDVYFINYIGDPEALDSPPLKSATITFWTSVAKPEHVSFRFNEAKYGRFKSTNSVDAPPSCGDINEITFCVKPGVYSYKAVYEKGNNVTLKDKKIQVEEDSCEVIYIPTKKEVRKRK